MSIKVDIKDPKSCRLAKLLKAISEYVEDSGNSTVSVNLDLKWYKKEKSEDAP